jgi:GT2 family glycosyltransferase
MWLINSDCRIDDDVAEKMIGYLEDHPDTAAVTGRLVSNDGTFQASCRSFPTFRNIIFSRQSPLSRLFPSRTVYTLPDFVSPTPVDSCACSCTMIRRRDFMEVGGFDPRFFMYCEDTDLCSRFAANGKRVVFLPEAEVTHLWARSWRGASWLRYYHHHRSMIRYFEKHHSKESHKVIMLEFLLIFGLGIRILVSLLRRDG